MLWRVAYRLLVVVSVLVGSIVQISRQPPVPAIEMTVYEDMMPGARLPADTWCEWQYYTQDSLPCHVMRNTTHIGLNYAHREGRIVATYYYLPIQHRIGDWVLSKGTPVRYQRTGNSVYISWADGMTAFVYAKVFRPDIPVFLIILGPDSVVADAQAWRGFVNN